MFYRRNTKIAFIVTLLLFVLFLNTATLYAMEQNQIGIPQDLLVTRNSNTSLRLRWSSVRNADGYIIYKYRNSSKKYIKIKTIQQAKQNNWVDTRLKTNKVYKYKVAAYKIVNGKKQTGELSYSVSAKTYKRSEKLINAHSPKMSVKQMALGLRSTEQLKAKVSAAKYGNNKQKKALSTKIRWYSDNEEIATVDQNGNVTAGVKAGNCTIYAVAHNGAKTGTKVTVKNYAKEDNFYNYGTENDVYVLITRFKTQIQNIAEYYSINRPEGEEQITISLNDDAELVIDPANTDIQPIKNDVEALLKDFPYDISISVSAGCVEFVSNREGYEFPAIVDFFFDDDCSQYPYIQIAPHWTAYRFYPD